MRALLAAAGYEIKYRIHDWVECLLIGDGEAWVGRGVDRPAAFADALRHAAPTRLAARLLAAAAEEGLDLPAHRWPPWDEVEAAAPPPRAATPLSPTPPRPEGVTVTDIEGKSPGQIAVIVSRPPPPRAPSGTFAVAAATDQRPVAEPPPVTDPEVALEELDILADRVRDSREELGLSSPERQRLAMLAWICFARAHADTFPDDLRIRDRVSAISRQLTDIGKTFWPGSVTALQLQMQPRDLPRHLLGGVATTWRRAAELAEQALRNKEHEDERRGFDGYGWADARLTEPPPENPAALLGVLVAEVEALSGPLGLQAAPADAAVRPDPAQFLGWIRRLRWLRGADVDPDAWSRLAGRFRWWTFRREPALQPAVREMEPTFLPAQPWAEILGLELRQRRQERELAELFAEGRRLPDAAACVDWLTRALAFGDTHHGNIVECARPFLEHIVALDAEQLPSSDRRIRRRFTKLKEDLVSGAPIDAADVPEPAAEAPIQAAANGAALPTHLLDRVRPATRGKRSVFVSNRRDPDLQARLQEAFAFELLECRIAEARRVQQLGEAIAESKYDLVLGATGFQSHSLDTVLARACRQAGVQYVRVNQGHPLTCLRAVARELGR